MYQHYSLEYIMYITEWEGKLVRHQCAPNMWHKLYFVISLDMPYKIYSQMSG